MWTANGGNLWPRKRTLCVCGGDIWDIIRKPWNGVGNAGKRRNGWERCETIGNSGERWGTV
eukprot:5470259-Alexandrium_andersonii.AAC.1